MTFNNVVLALDLSLNGPGFAVLAITSEGHPIILEKSHIKSRAAAKHGEKLSVIGEKIEHYLLEYSPEHIVREKGFSRFAATTQALYKVFGVADLVMYDYREICGSPQEAHEIAPTSVKKAVTGNGKASKVEVADAVLRILQIDQADYFANDDESDAAGVGLAYYLEKGLIIL